MKDLAAVEEAVGLGAKVVEGAISFWTSYTLAVLSGLEGETGMMVIMVDINSIGIIIQDTIVRVNAMGKFAERWKNVHFPLILL